MEDNQHVVSIPAFIFLLWHFLIFKKNDQVEAQKQKEVTEASLSI